MYSDATGAAVPRRGRAAGSAHARGGNALARSSVQIDRRGRLARSRLAGPTTRLASRLDSVGLRRQPRDSLSVFGGATRGRLAVLRPALDAGALDGPRRAGDPRLARADAVWPPRVGAIPQASGSTIGKPLRTAARALPGDVGVIKTVSRVSHTCGHRSWLRPRRGRVADGERANFDPRVRLDTLRPLR